MRRPWRKVVVRGVKNHRVTGLYMYAALRRLGYEKPQSGFALCTVFSPPQFGQGSMLRIALLPAQTVIYSRDVICHTSWMLAMLSFMYNEFFVMDRTYQSPLYRKRLYCTHTHEEDPINTIIHWLFIIIKPIPQANGFISPSGYAAIDRILKRYLLRYPLPGCQKMVRIMK